MRMCAGLYTPYRVRSFSWMTGGKLATWAAQPAASCCLKPCSSWWNITFSSGDGWFHLTMALQNHKRLYKAKLKSVGQALGG